MCRRCWLGRPCGEVSHYGSGCRCPLCVAWHSRECAEYEAKRKASGRPIQRRPAMEVRECAQCGTPFQVRASSPTQNCSLACAGEFRRKDRPPKVSPRYRRAMQRLEKAARGSRSSRVWVSGPCATCGTHFAYPDQQARYCSTACRNRAHSGRWIDYLDRLAIYRRDDWTCQICGEVTEPDADPTSAWFPSLDHIIPRSQGGPDDWHNLRTAHNWCNSVRGDLTTYSDSDLAA